MTQEKIEISALLYLDTQTLTYYSPTHGDVINLNLTSEVIQDLEITNESALERVIKNWMQQSKITPGQILLLTSPNTYFPKQLAAMPSDTNDPEVQAFLDLVPFDDVQVNMYQSQDSSLVIAQNKLLIEPMVAVLERLGFKVLCIAGAFSVGMSGKEPFTAANGQAAMAALEQVMSYNTLTPEQVLEKITVKDDFLAVKFDSKLIAMSAAFVILVLILIGLIVYQRMQ